MPRPRHDGTPAAQPAKARLTDLLLKKLKPRSRAFLLWDTHQRGLAVVTQRTGHKSFKAIYSFHGRPRWYHIGNIDAVDLKAARKLAGRVMVQVAEGKDPAAERRAERGKGTFEELAARYVEEHAKRKNKSWAQADALVRKHLLSRWGKLPANSIARADVKAAITAIAAPIVANQTLAAASAIYTWAIKEEIVAANPCKLVERHATKSRERVLSDSEIPKFWAAFDDAGLLASTALKLILLTGQRPGEVIHLRREHIADGWWTLPGEPDRKLNWPGTKNGHTHRIWLPAPVQVLLAEIDGPELFTGQRLDTAMRAICRHLGVERATPHDLRRTHGTTITGLGFGREAMNRIQNHIEGGIASVYDRHSYAAEIKHVMDAVAAHIMALAEGKPLPSNVAPLRRAGAPANA